MTWYVKRISDPEGTYYIISDVYLMALTALITYYVAKAVKRMYLKRQQHNELNKQIPRGGKLFDIGLNEDTELSYLIETCVKDDNIYLVNNPKIKEIIYTLAKLKLRNGFLVITPNLIRFIASVKLKKSENTWIQVGKLLVRPESRERLSLRLGITAITVAVNVFIGRALDLTVELARIMVMVYFITADCWVDCDAHFQKLTLSPDNIVRVYNESPRTPILAIAGNDVARQIQIYVPSEQEVGNVCNIPEQHFEFMPSKSANNKCDIKEKEVIRKYKPIRKKARMVKFSDFRQNDPVLKAFKGEKEPYSEPNDCPAHALKDLSDMDSLE